MSDYIRGYCSWCFEYSRANLVEHSYFTRNLYRCSNCKRRVVECRACKNLSCWDSFEIENPDGSFEENKRHDQFCKEHSHEVANFSTMNAKLEEPTQWEIVLKPRVSNLSKTSTMILVGGAAAAITGPLALAAGPAIGGVIGGAMGLSGAAATSAGLAALGGGALAVGGLGMAGGLMVITAVGASVGGSLGAAVANAHYQTLPEFDIVKVQDGTEPAIITINGFGTEDDMLLEDWEKIVTRKFYNRKWYHVHWQSQKLFSTLDTALYGNVTMGAGTMAGKMLVKFQTAVTNSESTGVILAEILKRCEGKEFTLIGHSLGARMIYQALSTLSSTGEKKIIDAHLISGAVSCDTSYWEQAVNTISGKVYNYYSTKDKTLGILYKIPNAFDSDPIGIRQIDRVSTVQNIDITDVLDRHHKQQIDHHLMSKDAATKFIVN